MDPGPRIQGNPDSHNKPLSLSNGSLKQHQHHLYMECMKNHAASLGVHSLDGCGEFMPSPSSSLLCAACGCHRNFHRHLVVSQHDLHDDDDEEDGGKERSSSSPPPAHMLLALRHSRPTSGATPRKRFRNKFSREQKERMVALSERLGWRMQKRDEVLIEESCKEIGVNRGVFKVWMHNNKRAFCVGSRKEEPRSERGDGGGNGNVRNGSSPSS